MESVAEEVLPLGITRMVLHSSCVRSFRTEEGVTGRKVYGERVIDSLALEQVSSKLHAKEGTAIKLAIERNADRSTIVVQTRPLLCTRDQPRSTSMPSK